MNVVAKYGLPLMLWLTLVAVPIWLKVSMRQTKLILTSTDAVNVLAMSGAALVVAVIVIVCWPKSAGFCVSI